MELLLLLLQLKQAMIQIITTVINTQMHSVVADGTATTGALQEHCATAAHLITTTADSLSFSLPFSLLFAFPFPPFAVSLRVKCQRVAHHFCECLNRPTRRRQTDREAPVSSTVSNRCSEFAIVSTHTCLSFLDPFASLQKKFRH